jgi:diguanylate cyclase (GGDEF)-like protein/PAS domain S-box-containing protein
VDSTRYLALADNLADTTVTVLDGDGRVVQVNGPLSRRHWSAGGMIGRRPEDLIAPEDAEVVNRRVMQALLEGRASNTEEHSPGGVDYILDVVPVQHVSGEREVLVVSRNITAMKEHLRRSLESEARWLAAFEHAPVAMSEVAFDGSILSANPALASLLGMPLAQVIGCSCFDLVHPNDRDAVVEDMALAAEVGGSATPFECRLMRSDGSAVWVAVHRSVLRPGGDQPDRILVHLVDVTAARARANAVEETSARFSALVEHGADMIAVLDPDLNLLYASPAYSKFLSGDGETPLGGAPEARVHPDDVGRVTRLLKQLVTQPGAIINYEGRVVGACGSWKTLDITASNQLDNPLIGGLVCNGRDVTERVEAAKQLVHQATHDALTGLANRALFMEKLAQALARAQASGIGCALLLLDLDKFKLVNDNLGHPTGDDLLIATAERLKTMVRPGDGVARLGGDEFVVLAEGVADERDAAELADRLLRSVSRPVVLKGRTVTVGCSIGIAVSNRNRPAVLLQEADIAMYRAKDRGRGRCELYDQGMRAVARRRLKAEETLRGALKRQAVTVLYQPVVDLTTGNLTGTEALARLKHPKGALVTPDKFIDVAEDSGLIVPLGATVLDQACAQQAEWGRQSPHKFVRVAVNLSGRQLASPGLVETVRHVLAFHGLNPVELCLELTESTLIDSSPSTRRAIEELKSLGVALALDDFGTGWSSLAYLRRFPIDVIKVDRSFVAGLGTSDEDAEVVRAVVSLGHALRLSTVAEGVETAEQASYLRDLGCDYGQGYLFGRPMLPVDLLPTRS